MLKDLLYPRTDAGALTQLIVVAVFWLASAVVLRHRRDIFTFVSGLVMITFAWFGLRALH